MSPSPSADFRCGSWPVENDDTMIQHMGARTSAKIGRGSKAANTREEDAGMVICLPRVMNHLEDIIKCRWDSRSDGFTLDLLAVGRGLQPNTFQNCNFHRRFGQASHQTFTISSSDQSRISFARERDEHRDKGEEERVGRGDSGKHVKIIMWKQRSIRHSIFFVIYRNTHCTAYHTAPQKSFVFHRRTRYLSTLIGLKLLRGWFPDAINTYRSRSD